MKVHCSQNCPVSWSCVSMKNSSINNTPQPCLPTLNFHWFQSSFCHLSLAEFDVRNSRRQKFWDLSRTGMAQMMPHTRYGFEPNQCLYVYKYVDQKGSTAMLRCYTGGESEESTARRWGTMEVWILPWFWNPGQTTSEIKNRDISNHNNFIRDQYPCLEIVSLSALIANTRGCSHLLLYIDFTID